ncbi:MAG: LysR family transcriptional regulator [Pseudomonadota bacterium]
MNLKTLDLNLLKVFEALASERNVTRAGERIGLTQSSVSNALNRMRQLFGDELFVRTPGGMMPTQRALQLEAPIRDSLNELRQAIADPISFDPSTASGTVRISTSDIVVMAIMSGLLRVVAEEAPNVDLRFIALDKRTLTSDLDQDRLDLAMTAFFEQPARLFTRPLLRERFICIARDGHPAFENGLSLERYVAYPHALVTFKADAKGRIDLQLAEMGLTRRVAITVGHFSLLPYILSETDYLATIPLSAASGLTQSGAFVTRPLPFELPDWTIDMFWSRRADRDPLQSWARDKILELAPDGVSTADRPPLNPWWDDPRDL